ncbi:hypothetical protein [Gottfriedia solisilvae]|uniref:Uncharacterized protein n=1 Tax=Gottfriedia solisilvae TaxID=1516104 RepID=A0A8J3AKJ4_9BACI|nr:hypothetical protein [Gottfriedia solisilvae]GGI12401.1 hypothetical protein GCM10007380_12730 [Gottfriedia solisilvae]
MSLKTSLTIPNDQDERIDTIVRLENSSRLYRYSPIYFNWPNFIRGGKLIFIKLNEELYKKMEKNV